MKKLYVNTLIFTLLFFTHPVMSHDVFFDLKNQEQKTKKPLLTRAWKSMKRHPFFTAGGILVTTMLAAAYASRVFPKKDQKFDFSNYKINVGVVSIQGPRDHMEDTFFIKSFGESHVLVGVNDGHGGSVVSSKMKSDFPDILKEELEKNLDISFEDASKSAIKIFENQLSQEIPPVLGNVNLTSLA